MSGRLFLLLFFVLQMAGTVVASWLLAVLDGCWWPFGPRYTVVELDGITGGRRPYRLPALPAVHAGDEPDQALDGSGAS